MKKINQQKSELCLLLPDIRSGFNVGSFFRTCDGLGISKIFLTGFTPYPPHKEIQKTALGAENFLDWSFHLQTEKLIKKLKTDNFKIIALEKDKNSIPLQNCQIKSKKICLVVGNEIEGINKNIISLADQIISIEMKGQKESLNVSIAGGIALFKIQSLLEKISF